MERLNMFNNKTVNNLDSDTKEAITIITEDSGSGYKFYKNLLSSLDYVNVICSKNGIKGIFDEVDAIPSSNIIFIFDAAIDFFRLISLKYKYNNLKLVEKKLYYFTPMCFEELLLSIECKDKFGIYKSTDFIDLIVDSYRNKKVYVDFLDMFFDNGKLQISINNEVYEASTLEKIYKQVAHSYFNGTRLWVNNKDISQCYYKSCDACLKDCKVSNDKLKLFADSSPLGSLLYLIKCIHSKAINIKNNRLVGVLK